MKTTDAISPDHINNFDFLRLLFATLVLVTHSYVLAGLPEQDTLWHFSHGQLLLSKLGVRGFFVISGFLILKSLMRSRSITEYCFKRIIRVFPALWIMVGITLVGGYFFSSKSVGAYFTDHSVPLYLLNLVLRLHISINGVFPNNPDPYEVNGSLWTVPYEVFFYLLLTPLFFIRHRLYVVRGLVLAGFMGLLVLHYTGQVFYSTYKLSLYSDQLIFLGLHFMAGALLALFPAVLRQARVRTILVWTTGLGLVAVLYFGGFYQTQFLLVPVFVLALGTSSYPWLNWLHRYGDISYGVYIWGWPVQQALVHGLHPSQPVLALLSIPTVWALGWASWHLVEKQALRLKLDIVAPAAATTRVVASDFTRLRQAVVKQA
ncbi:acyltransferase [Hymenobacter sp. YC55]|uniref:acyltransferase family protein n=1 Tax=Hymenobacter sp. YC55 TaxID=3034019 RepID=UPI0023F731F6|nr:acyltransferase [Hymenobacter sp. YC55]MDF7814854.1 acyltransferase [Hymenobacter sp. YC55]